MIYCISDIHGRIDLFNEMLDLINFGKDDMLYVLGDCIDRGGGLAVLQKIFELEKEGRAKLIQGNHELVFAVNIFGYDEGIVDRIAKADNEKNMIQSQGDPFSLLLAVYQGVSLVDEYQKEAQSEAIAQRLSLFGGYQTYQEFKQLSENEQIEIVNRLLVAPKYIDVTVNDKDYRLAHAGFKSNGDVDTFIRDDFFVNPSPFSGKTIIFGHTTTKEIRMNTEHIYRQPTIWFDEKHNDKICIDCGCAYAGGRLACLRLDDMAEFYINNKEITINPLSVLNLFLVQNNYDPHFVGVDTPNKLILNAFGKSLDKKITKAEAEDDIDEESLQLFKIIAEEFKNHGVIRVLDNPT